MGATRYASVLDLAFGDSGKGLFVDALTRRWRAHTVVRFSGGAQAGHNVVTPAEIGAPSRHHTFAQFGAGTFVPGTATVLLDPFVLHPTALLVEAQALAAKGVPDALSRLLIDARCRITTPFHQAAGRWRELARGPAAHGTCGVGVGETVGHSLAHPAETLRFADLGLPESAALEKLHAIRGTLLADLAVDSRPGTETERCVFEDEGLALRWLRAARALARHCPPAPIGQLRDRLTKPGAVLFEGAQGLLLDEWHGFHPHTTWSSVTPAAVEAAAAPLDPGTPIEHFGVLRTYLTRHGAGPFPTHDPALDAALPEPHNHPGGWQGPFRRGHPDAVLLRHALQAAGRLSGLFISHLDVFHRSLPLRWCEAYATPDGPSAPLENLPPGPFRDLQHQSSLTRLLQTAQPIYRRQPIASAGALLDALASVTPIPIVLHASGPTANDVADSPHVCALDLRHGD